MAGRSKIESTLSSRHLMLWLGCMAQVDIKTNEILFSILIFLKI